MSRGPYVSEDYSEFYLPVRAYSFNTARHEAAQWARTELIPNFGRTRYIGKQEMSLHDHEDWEECEACPVEPTWCFEVYEGPWRE